MAATPSFDFAILFVQDPDAAKTYFVETLGFQHVPEESVPGFHFLHGDGGIAFGLRPGGDTPDTHPVGTVLIYLKVNDLEGQRQAYLAAGVGASAIMARPFGQIFELPAYDGIPLTVLGG